MSKIDINYHSLLETILEKGYLYDDPNREGVKRLEIPSYTFRHEFKDGFPAISTKKLHYKNVVTELLWFLKGDTNIKYLIDNGCNIWNKDAYNYYRKNIDSKTPYDIDEFKEYIENNDLNTLNKYNFGDLGPVYGHQWRSFSSLINTGDGILPTDYDQIQRLITNLKKKPLATDHIVNAWNVSDLDNMALPPCHYGFQIVVRPLNFNEKLDLFKDKKPLENSKEFKRTFTGENIPKYGFELHWNQRSVDTFLGLPYNIASYATLALIIEKITGYKALVIQGDLKKVHLYDNSLDAVKEQLSRDPNKYNNCNLLFNEGFLMDLKTNGLDISLSRCIPEDIKLKNYESYPAINVEMLERDE